jgi:hypothetical protein
MLTSSHFTENVIKAIEALLNAIRHENEKWVEVGKAEKILFRLRTERESELVEGEGLEGIINANNIEQGAPVHGKNHGGAQLASAGPKQGEDGLVKTKSSGPAAGSHVVPDDPVDIEQGTI